MAFLIMASMGICAAAMAAPGASAPPVDRPELTTGDLAIRRLLGEGATTIRVWPGEAPDETATPDRETAGPVDKRPDVTRVSNVTRPTLTIVKPGWSAAAAGAAGATSPTPAVVVCPGGGYNVLAVDLEGAEIVRWLNSLGVTGILLKYRVPDRRPGLAAGHHALQDAQRAIGVVRQHASEWSIDPARVGIIGFSAGGHLAASLCNNHGARLYEPVDAADGLSCRPDFAILIYPAYLTTPIDSDDLDPRQRVAEMSPERTPPTFVAIARNDKFTRGALRYYQALAAAGVSAELHVYDGGAHGSGLRQYPLSDWTDAGARWLRDREFIGRSAAK